MADERWPDDLGERWYEYWRLRSGSPDERKALALGRPAQIRQAHDLVADLVSSGGTDAVDVLVYLAEAAPAGDDGMTVGVGPLEELISNRTEGVMSAIATAARRSPSFGRALRHAVLPADFSADRYPS